ncbi:MAG: extracellular solute-binding protein [Deinococcus sp.]|nr:extracellular solute-binding protein [Deinococcus sp.]
MKQVPLILSGLILLTLGLSLAQGPVTIVLWDQFFPAAQLVLVDDLIAQFEAQNPGINVERTVFDTDSLRTALRPALSDVGGPDVFYFDSGWGTSTPAPTPSATMTPTGCSSTA